MRLWLAVLTACPLALGQQAVAPTPDRPDQLAEKGEYTVSNSFEVGYRFADVGGNRDVYRASVNYGNGIRLLEGQLRINSKGGKGTLVDDFSFRTSGAVTDPYQSHIVRAEKNGWYRYDMQYRVSRYYNRLPALWQGEHGLNTERTLQSHDFTLRPGSRFEILFGYDRNRRTGPGFASEGIGDRRGGFDRASFLRYQTDLDQRNNQYRGGVNTRFLGLALTAIQSVDDYREDNLFGDGSRLPTDVSNVQPVESLLRSEPFTGRTPVTTVALRTEKERWIGFSARYVYASGERNSTLNQELGVLDPGSGTTTNRQTFVVGDADRKQSSGDFTVLLLPSARWTITNTTAFNNTRINGQTSFLEVSLFRNEFLTFEHLGIRHITNASEVNFRPVKQVSLYGAYRFSTRRITTSDAFRFPEFTFETELAEVDNDVKAGAVGVRWLPAPGVRASFDFEAGRADRPLTPVSEREFHNESARIQWRKDGFSVSAFLRNKVNNNPTQLLQYSSESRSGGAHVSWVEPESGLTFDGGYTYLGLDTSAGILNLFDLTGQERGLSIYTSNIHNVNLGVRATPVERLTLYAGYSLTKDTGDGRAPGSTAGGLAYPNFNFDGANVRTSFPLTYQSPQGRVSVAITDQLSWNLGWQFYNYTERFTGLQGYRAHVGYTSLRIGF